MMCQHDEKKLRAYPFILILYLEKNTQNGEKLNTAYPVATMFSTGAACAFKACHEYKDMYNLAIVIFLLVCK